MKKCSKCFIIKDINNFYKLKKDTDKYQASCKECFKLYYEDNADKISKVKKNYYERNKDDIIKIKTEYYYKNITECKLEQKKYRENNKVKIYLKQREYTNRNREVINEKERKYRKSRRDSIPIVRLKINIRNRLNNSLRVKFWNKSSKFSEYIGCTQEQLKLHIESQFEPWMTWDNWGKIDSSKQTWNIDHIIPLNSANTEEELYKLCHYTNLRPLLALDNLKKSDKIIT